MSQHRSLKPEDKDKKHKSVLNRFERIKMLKEKGHWEEGNSVFGLPKVKVTKVKLKKEKLKEAEEKEVQEQPQKEKAQEKETKGVKETTGAGEKEKKKEK